VRVLVTGGCGFIGSHIANGLAKRGHTVVAYDNMSGGSMDNVDTHSVRVVVGDCADVENMDQIANRFRPEVVYHLAANAREGASFFDPRRVVKDNLFGFTTVLERCLAANGVKKVVMFSSMAIYGIGSPPFNEDDDPKPCDVYGVAKAAMEQTLRCMAGAHGFEWTIIRPHNVFGPGQRLDDPYRNVVGIFTNRAMRGEPIYMYGEGHERAFSYIDDSLTMYLRAVDDDKFDGRVVNVGGEEVVTIRELAIEVLKNFPLSRSKIKVLPPRYGEVKHAYCEHPVARSLGFEPMTPLAEGVRRYCEWAKRQGKKDWRYEGLAIESDLMPETWREKK